ncbi:hypothetical protein H0H92_010645 [Tricholoma furcatifolium]|nr:hypothetical protein H0H92_010645 [Tricholoma furcatifolium]
MGRRKIEIQPITRKNGLFKKAYELGVLCSVDVAVIVFEERPGHHLKLYQYGSSDIHEIIQRHLHHDGEKDTRGPADFSNNATAAKDDTGDGDDGDDDDEADDPVLPSIRGPKRRVDGQAKQGSAEAMSPDMEYLPPRTLVHSQHASRVVPPSVPPSLHHHSHPVSNDRLSGPLHSQSKRPRLGIPHGNLVRSRSSDDDPMSSALSPVSASRSRYPNLDREFSSAPSGYGLSHSHGSSGGHHRQHNPQYTSFFPASTHYGQAGGTPPPPNFIPLQSPADFAASATRARSSSGSGVLAARNVYGSYGEGNAPPGSAGGGSSGDIFAAFMDAEQHVRASMPRRSATAAPDVGSGGGSPFGIDWPVHMRHGGDGVGSKPGSHSSVERDGGRSERGASTGPGSASGNGSSNGPGPDPSWLDFLGATTANGPPP